MLNAVDRAIAEGFDAVASEMKDAANIIREQGVVRAVGGEMAKAVEQVGGSVFGSSPTPSALAGPTRARHVGSPSKEQLEAALAAVDFEEAALGSAELPSLGSALHSLHTCKPCAFFLQGACKDNQNCRFCHLCEPGEKKRRRKVWQTNKKEAKCGSPIVAAFAGSSPVADAFSPLGRHFGSPVTEKSFQGHAVRLSVHSAEGADGASLEN